MNTGLRISLILILQSEKRKRKKEEKKGSYRVKVRLLYHADIQNS